MLDCPDDAVPPWCLFPEPPAGGSIPPELREELLATQHTIRAVLAEHLWPDAHDVQVGFETHDRVETGGGWQYVR